MPRLVVISTPSASVDRLDQPQPDQSPVCSRGIRVTNCLSAVLALKGEAPQSVQRAIRIRTTARINAKDSAAILPPGAADLHFKGSRDDGDDERW